MRDWRLGGGAGGGGGGPPRLTPKPSIRSWRRSTGAPASLRYVVRSRSRARPSTTHRSGSAGAVRANMGPRSRNQMHINREQGRGKRLNREEGERASFLRRCLADRKAQQHPERGRE